MARFEGVDIAATQGRDELVGKRLGAGQVNAHAVAVAGRIVGYRVQQVRLADSRRAADEEWVVSGSGVLGDGKGGAVGEAIAAADHELFEAVLGVNLIAGFCLPARLRSQRAELGAFARGAYVDFGVGADNALR